MEGMEEEADLISLPSPSPVVAVAISGKKNSRYIIRWSLEKFLPEGIINFKLIHVTPRITSVPTPNSIFKLYTNVDAVGNSIPVSQVRDDVAAAYRKEIGWQTNEKLLPYTKMFAQRKVQLDVVTLEADDVANAIIEEVTKCSISKLVIGVSSQGFFSRKLNGLSSRISALAPRHCTVYAISKGQLASIRPPNMETNVSIDDASEASSANSYLSYSSSSVTDSSSSLTTSYSDFPSSSPSLPLQRFQALSTINQTLLTTKSSPINADHSRCQSVDIEDQVDGIRSSSYVSDCARTLSRDSSCKSSSMDGQSWVDEASSSGAFSDHVSCESQTDVTFELEKLRIKLRHARGMYAIAQRETIDASRKLNHLNKQRSEDARKLDEIKNREAAAKEFAREERTKREALRREAKYVKERAEREGIYRKEAETKALQDAKEKGKHENALEGPLQQYQHFQWEDIVSATSSFSEDLKLGMGAHGTVYKCSLHHTTVAVKVLHSRDDHKKTQFLQELEILSKIHHPHLLLLLGACPDMNCLVYEYMENGSLEDRLYCRGNTPAIPWYERFRIAWEIASALVFLHSSKPKPIIHRDLKPANILLDRNLVSKIGDVGLSTVFNSDPLMSTAFKNSGPVGTLCYIDPEYQRSGLISPKSDVYAFGMVILQLLTAKPAVALTHVVETAIDNCSLDKVLDIEAGHWPVEETYELARLGLHCAEMQRKDRPDLKDHVLPLLLTLKKVADEARSLASKVPAPIPNHFICPILQDVMNDPCVAADGYTYDRWAIEKWLQENDNSPITKLPLADKNLIPNFSLLSAIVEWNSRKN
ncbi:U-box domain-containing protein 35-like isoform X1 [Cucurbita pepo subsp. pepo]|uniref:U-box domain-containing protein 35-like n=1 Tax=Cucurbita pepo subsp. pepo TaxID=3664 RepID=UPI000C9D592B|nr:U-box domain-containing protein 35-like [Cucurbita pepo subsp. pepo]XP_023550277.1 U-box domain-containing protein 35-like isoform X1 [Cucurbita pepo subsp. pepo]XP_023550278.1 U-box domain-containing protein 35-like isoform X1 [Cucurbita pepo subsp. pepo]XP_023550279.1 U-box domain-containing protein 35-like isoform X1 [Cucurbita pepo subsp. pepo]